MNDLDFRPPTFRPAPSRLRGEIADQLTGLTGRPRRRGRLAAVRVLVAAAVAVLVLAGVAVVARHLRAPAPSAPGPIGTLDVRRLSPAEAQSQLASCLAEPVDGSGPDADRVAPSDPAAWTVVYARVQHLVGSRPDGSASVLWARAGEVGLRCVDGRRDSTLDPMTPAVGGRLGTDQVTSPIEDDLPNVACTADEAAFDPTALLYATAAGVRTVQVRLVLDGRPGPWRTTGAEGGLASIPLLDDHDFTGLGSARTLAYEVQALDASGTPTPVVDLWHAATPTVVRQVPTCADRAGTGVRPTKVAAADTECARLVNAARSDDAPQPVLARDDGPDSLLSVVGDERNPTLCSLWPVRAVRSVATGPAYDGQSSTADQVQRLSFSAQPVGAGVAIFGGGRLDADVTAVTYTFPDGRRVPARLLGGYWILSDVTTAPFLDGRPLDRLPPAEVEVVRTDGSHQHLVVPFPGTSGCDHELVLPEQTC